MTEHLRVWLGRVAPDQRETHEAFVTWLQSDEASAQFAKYLLTGYTLFQHGDLLKVVMRAEEPLAFIRFLRTQRMWPPFWEFVAAAHAEHEASQLAEEHAQVRVDWRSEDETRRRRGPGRSRDQHPRPTPPTASEQG